MSNKLHPIYVALENHQYSRAIKLCLGLTPSNTGGQALLALAYAKNSQRPEALRQLKRLLPIDQGFPELCLVLKYVDATSPPEEVPTTLTPAVSKKGGKKKKGAKQKASTPVAQSVVSPVTESSLDLIDLLDNPPSLPEDWEKLPPVTENTPTDSDLLGTIGMVLSNLSLPLTAYQMYCWALQAREDNIDIAEKAVLKGLAVLLAPQYQNIAPAILANMQVLSLQLSRLEQIHYNDSSSAMAWAAQTALWQLKEGSSEKIDQRLAMLPRLAESMASKCLEASGSTSNLTEKFRLYLRSLACQSKWEESLDTIRSRLPPTMSKIDGLVMEVDVLEKMKKYDEALAILAEHLLRHYPDNWDYWQLYIRLTLLAFDGDTECLSKAVSLANSLEREGGYPLRGPHLVSVHVASLQINNTEESLRQLRERLQSFADIFSGRVSCTFSDLRPYLDILLEKSTIKDAMDLLRWLSHMHKEPSSSEATVRRTQLRQYIFATQMIYATLVIFPGLEVDFLPASEDLMRVWFTYQQAETAVQAQLENRPADELVLLATQQLMRGDSPSAGKCILAAALLESGIRYSPANAYLKIAAILVYQRLHAASLSLDYFTDVMIKHIQFESCSYLILPCLLSGGLYREVIAVCKKILQLQTTSSREAADCSVRALRNGILSKAEEFLDFHRTRMNRSQTTVEAKGLILDCAPMFQPEQTQDLAPLGAYHGLVGIETDVERATQMIGEGHNPFAAFSLLGLELSPMDISENRDFTVLETDILGKHSFEDSSEVIGKSMRRGNHHGLLLRACLCVDEAVGPKKGKLVKPTEKILKRCRSLADCAKACLGRLEHWSIVEEDEMLLRAMVDTCYAVAVIGGGPLSQNAQDSLSSREAQGAEFIASALGHVDRARSVTNTYASLSAVSYLVADCVVPLFAVFRMCAKLLDKFGWGPRKRQTKLCAGSLADLSLGICAVVSDLSSVVER